MERGEGNQVDFPRLKYSNPLLRRMRQKIEGMEKEFPMHLCQFRLVIESHPLKSMMLEEKEVHTVPATPCELVNSGRKFDSWLVDNNVNNLRATKAWIRHNTDIKDHEELDMPKQDGNKWKGASKEIARKAGKIREKRER